MPAYLEPQMIRSASSLHAPTPALEYLCGSGRPQPAPHPASKGSSKTSLRKLPQNDAHYPQLPHPPACDEVGRFSWQQQFTLRSSAMQAGSNRYYTTYAALACCEGASPISKGPEPLHKVCKQKSATLALPTLHDNSVVSYCNTSRNATQNK